MIKFIFIIILVVFLSPTALAQDQPNFLNFFQELGWQNLPQPLIDLFNTFQKFKPNIKLQGNETFFNKQNLFVFEKKIPSEVIFDFTQFFNKINNWFQINLGVSLEKIIRVIGNFFIWILELIIKLIKAGLAAL